MGTAGDTMARLGRGNTLAVVTERSSAKKLRKMKYGKRNVSRKKKKRRETDLARRGCSWH
jgi:hypothetical protein